MIVKSVGRFVLMTMSSFLTLCLIIVSHHCSLQVQLIYRDYEHDSRDQGLVGCGPAWVSLTALELSLT